MRNKNKLVNTLVGAFAVIFFAGVAFAFAPGIIDINGTVNIATPEYVTWTNVEAGPGLTFVNPNDPDPEGWEYGATHTAQIVDERGRTNQRIEWDIYFTEEGFADITATATNESALHSAIISNLNYGWLDVPFDAAEFGLDLAVVTTSFVGTVLTPEATATVSLSVEWDGTVPDWFVIDEDEGFELATTFFIEFDYELAP